MYALSCHLKRCLCDSQGVRAAWVTQPLKTEPLVYPDPAANSTTLFLNKALQGTARINITDRIGRLVRGSSQPAQKRELIIDLTGMAAGHYL